MIKELAEFTKNLSENIKSRALQPKDGLHILVDFDEEGNYNISNYERFIAKKNNGLSTFLEDCAKKQKYSWMVDTNKCFDLPAKGIHSASPYCVAFKKTSWYGGEKYEEKSANAKKPTLPERLGDYFEKCFDDKFQLYDIQKQKALKLKYFVRDQLNEVLEQIQEYQDLSEGEYIVVYLNQPLEDYQLFNSLYLQDKLFNTDEYNVTSEVDVYGTSDFFNGYNSKKPFLMHQTASFDISGRISATDAKYLSEFLNLARQKVFPNPLPIFIDQQELTEYVITYYHREEGKQITHREIIKSLLQEKINDIGNYYLLYFSMGTIQDFDFVPKFKYHLKDDSSPLVIDNIFELQEKKDVMPSVSLYNVFDFERVMIRQLFNNTLVRIDEKKDQVSFKYFDEIDAKYYRPDILRLILNYRKPIYDFIYKSMHHTIGENQFMDICMTGIMDDLRQNQSYRIKQKLNILFSLYDFFTDKPENHNIMPTKIEEHKNHLQQVVDDEQTHFKDDYAYAFGTGQLIYYLLSQSEAGDKSHALLEPYLQKSNYKHFNEAIINTINKYKHAISFDYKRFNKLAGEVLDYEAEQPLSGLRTYILAGYFSPNILYKKKQPEETKPIEN